MATTPIYAFPYPTTSDAPNGPTQIQSLAQAVETKIATMDAAPITGRIIARGRRTTPSTATTTTAQGVLRLDDVPIKNGRSYRIEVTGIFGRSSVNADRVLVSIRFTTDGSTPTNASATLVGGQVYQWVVINAGSTGQTAGSIDVEYEPGADQTLSLLVCVVREVGTGNVDLYADASHVLELKIYDSGPAVGNTGTSV